MGLKRASTATSWKMPRTLRDLWTLLDSLKYDVDLAFIEKVSAMPKQGVSSTFKFGYSAGALEMALVAAGIPYRFVTPVKWCGALGLRKKPGESNTNWKCRHKALAQSLFPQLKITHANADALLIAEYGRREENLTAMGIDPGQSGAVAVVNVRRART